MLHIDSPDLGIERAGYFQDEPLPKFIEAMEMHVAALNEALADIPPERVRFHACWGNRDSPHVNGFGTIVGDTQVSEDVVWAKLEAMRDGAAIASKRLWS